MPKDSTGDQDRDDAMLSALEQQRQSCASLGSQVQVHLLDGLIDDFRSGGTVRHLLAERKERPLHDAVPLRLLGGLHRLVLAGIAPRLARHYPTVGGHPGDSLVSDALDTLNEHTAEIRQSLSRPVQTNEVGRSVVLMAAARWLHGLGESHFDLVEVGSSAGLNLFFEQFHAPVTAGGWGPVESSVHLSADAVRRPPPSDGKTAIAVRRWGSDPNPVNLDDDSQRVGLLSFVWPDHVERFARLASAVELARADPPRVDTASADETVERLRADELERCTVVFHSIVWQYMGPRVQRRFVDGLHEVGARSRRGHKLIWLRMEPAGPTADVRATVWTDDTVEELVLATVGYHGVDLNWNPRLAADDD
ncbi:MAG: DUF2332 domain-containing protein [Ilumatobacteraceae bacterium]